MEVTQELAAKRAEEKSRLGARARDRNLAFL
jgi:hypothetical protein